MSNVEARGPGYLWADISIEQLQNGEYPEISESAENVFDVHKLYPLPSSRGLQKIYYGRRTDTASANMSDLEISYTIYNNSGENGTIIWHPGYGVNGDTPGGARSALMVAALNPDYKVIVPEEATGVSDEAKRKALNGDFRDYALGYLLVTEKEKIEPDVIAGRSRGGPIAIHTASELPIKLLNIQETSVLPSDYSGLGFTFWVGVVENIKGNKQNKGSDKEEENRIAELPIRTRLENNPGPLEMLARYPRNKWLIHGLGRASLTQTVELALVNNPSMRVVWNHARFDTGMPIEKVRQAVLQVYDNIPFKDRERLEYMESNGGHHAIGHTPLGARLIRLAIDRTLQ